MSFTLDLTLLRLVSDLSVLLPGWCVQCGKWSDFEASSTNQQQLCVCVRMHVGRCNAGAYHSSQLTLTDHVHSQECSDNGVDFQLSHGVGSKQRKVWYLGNNGSVCMCVLHRLAMDSPLCANPIRSVGIKTSRHQSRLWSLCKSIQCSVLLY